MIDVRVQAAEVDPGRQLARLGERGIAASAFFIGRLEAAEEVTGFFVDHYAPLARSELRRIVEQAQALWSLDSVVLIHRHGRIAPGGTVLFAGVGASDVAVSQQACIWLVAETRQRAPFWCRELMADGSSRWR